MKSIIEKKIFYPFVVNFNSDSENAKEFFEISKEGKYVNN